MWTRRELLIALASMPVIGRFAPAIAPATEPVFSAAEIAFAMNLIKASEVDFIDWLREAPNIKR